MNGARRIHRRNLLVWLALLVLLAATAGSAYVPMGMWNSVINLAIAAAKLLLVAIFFMHLGTAHGTVRLTAMVALFVLVILFGLSATDYRSRQVYPAPWQDPQQLPSPGAGRR